MLDARSLPAEQGGVDFRWPSINPMDIFSNKPIKEKIRIN